MPPPAPACAAVSQGQSPGPSSDRVRWSVSQITYLFVYKENSWITRPSPVPRPSACAKGRRGTGVSQAGECLSALRSRCRDVLIG